MNIKKFNRTIIILIIVILVITLGIPVAFYFSTMKLGDNVAQGQEIVKTSLGDEFLFGYATVEFPEFETYVNVYENNKGLGSYTLGSYFIKPEITVQKDSKILRCYEVNKGLLIYRFNNGVFKGISRNQINHENRIKIINSELVELGKELFDKNEWKWIEFFGEFLVKNGDSEMKKTLERYSLGQFTQEELDQNKDSDFNKEDMQAFAGQVLQQK